MKTTKRDTITKRKIPAHQGRQHSMYELQTVAAIWLEAKKNGLPVQQTIARAMDVPLSTATKRIMAARKRGLIPNISADPTGRERATKRLQVQVTQSQRKTLEKLARAAGMNVSEYVRSAVFGATGARRMASTGARQ